MLVKNDSTPLVVLALVMLFACAVFGGMIVWADPLGPGGDARATREANNSHATEIALNAVATQQAAFSAQTAIPAQMTAVAPAQTATAFAINADRIALEYAATQTAISVNAYMNGAVAASTATALVRNSAAEKTQGFAGIAIAVVGVATICLWIIIHSITSLLNARTQNNFSETRVLIERRKSAEIQAPLEKQPGLRPATPAPLPTSLIKQPRSVHGLPRGE